jgi:FeS assembly SUF system regulator
MFKLNRMTDYAIVVLGALAHRQGEILATAQLAELTGLNQPTVAKVAKTLMAADLLETQRGVHGGYRLAQPAAATSLVQIVEAMEGPIAVNDCVDGAQAPCVVSNCCFMSRNWNRVNLAVRNALSDVSLEDLIDPAQLFTPTDHQPAADRQASTVPQNEILS